MAHMISTLIMWRLCGRFKEDILETVATLVQGSMKLSLPYFALTVIITILPMILLVTLLRA